MRRRILLVLVLVCAAGCAPPPLAPSCLTMPVDTLAHGATMTFTPDYLKGLTCHP